MVETRACDIFLLTRSSQCQRWECLAPDVQVLAKHDRQKDTAPDEMCWWLETWRDAWWWTHQDYRQNLRTLEDKMDSELLAVSTLSPPIVRR